MFDPRNPVFWLFGAVLLGGLFWLLHAYFGKEAREARRRTRSHGRVVSRGRRTWIKLAARTEKSNSGRKADRT